MLRLLVILLLTLPFIEIWGLYVAAERYGWYVLAYVFIVALLGYTLIQEEKTMIAGRMVAQIKQGEPLASVVLGSAKNILAGILLIIPGFLTDLIAVVLLLMPANGPKQMQSSGAASAGNNKKNKSAQKEIIEGEYRRED